MISYQEPSKDIEAGKVRAPSILIVSSDKASVRQWNRQLSRNFPRHLVKVSEASSGAVKAISSQNPPCALLDITDTVQSCELLQSIRKESPNTGIIIVSEACDPASVAQGLKLGAVDFLDKSAIEENSLIEAVRGALNHSSSTEKFPLRAQDLDASEPKYDDLEELVFVVRASDGLVVDVGRKGLAAFGLEPREVIGQKLGHIGLLGRGGKWKTLLDACASTQESRDVLVAEHGLRREFSVRARCEKFGGSKHYFVVAKDRSKPSRCQSKNIEKAAINSPSGIAARDIFESQLSRRFNAQGQSSDCCGLFRVRFDQQAQITASHGEHIAENIRQNIALTLQHSIRQESDIVAFYSDRQIAVFLEKMQPAHAVAVAGRLVKRVRNSKVVPAGINGQTITISIGAAAGNAGDESGLAELFDSAALALTQASGRGDRAVAVLTAE